MLETCPVCRYEMFTDQYQMCEICGWDHDRALEQLPDLPGGMHTLRESQRNYQLYGAVCDYALDGVRSPRDTDVYNPQLKSLLQQPESRPYSQRYGCRCCGYKTIFTGWEVCEICGWEYSAQQTDPDNVFGPNVGTLRESQHNFLSLGARRDAFVGKLRRPTENDVRDEKWRKFDPPLRKSKAFPEVDFAYSACLCCGYYGINGRRCRYCFWEFSPQQENPDDVFGPNPVSFRVAQNNFLTLGAVTTEFVREVERPKADDRRLSEWQPLP